MDKTKQTFRVEKAKPEDAEGVFNGQRLTWIATYPNVAAGITKEDIRTRVEGVNKELIPQKIERWRKSIETSGENHAVFVVKDTDKVVGFVAPAILNGQRRIGAIYVLPESQGKGIGQKLLNKAIEWHGSNKDIFLHVASYNRNAINFYVKNGFKKTDSEIKDDTELVRTGKVQPIPEVEMVLKS